MQIAIYGKGGIGKSTIAANISAALASGGKRVLQVGCDPKHDSTRLLLGGRSPQTVLDYIRVTSPDKYRVSDVIMTGEFGVDCAESGGPEPGIGCAGRGILTTFDMLEKLGIRNHGYDAILYDVLGDVVCGGFAVPIRNEYADRVYIITSGEFMSIYAANNILRGLANYQTNRGRVGGIIFNARGGDYEQQRVQRFADAVQLPILATIPRDDIFAASERAKRCVVAEFPQSDLATMFRTLAQQISSDSELYLAQPLTDEHLEQRILEDSSETHNINNNVDKTSPSAPATATAATTPVTNPAATVTPATASPTSTTNPLLSKAMVYKEPLHGCAFSGALGVAIQLTDCISIAHGPASCAHIAFQAITSISRRMLLERGTVIPIQTAPPIVSTDMNETVMIFGGAEPLLQRIEAAKQKNPRAIFVISTCPSGIIGEDLSSLPELSDGNTQVIPIATDGNLTGDNLQGVLMGYQLIAEQIIDRSLTPESKLINIVAEKPIANATAGNLQFANDIFDRLGLKLNCRFLCESSYDKVRSFKKAGLNVLAYADYMGEALKSYLEQNYDAVFMNKPMPIGFADSSEWVRDLAEYAECPEAADAIIADYQQLYQAEVARLRPILEGKRLMVVTFNHSIDWILSTALDVGMELSFVGILDYSQDHRFNTSHAGSIRELHPSLDYSAVRRSDDVRRVAPDVLLGNYLPREDMGNIVNDTIQLCPDVGFLSGIKMAARWAEMMRADLGEGWRRDAELYSKYRA
ncbi:MAG: AAA family ATPase [Coriobacteriia bacterium]|nr:AAA family ATPase [Coriobacteriia bacterium]